MLEVFFTESRQTGPVDRWSITPLPPSILKKDDLVVVTWEGIDYDAKMMDNWKGEVKWSKRDKIMVYFPFDKSKAILPRKSITPAAPEKLVAFSNVRAKWKNGWYDAITCESWSNKVINYFFYVSKNQIMFFLKVNVKKKSVKTLKKKILQQTFLKAFLTPL